MEIGDYTLFFACELILYFGSGEVDLIWIWALVIWAFGRSRIGPDINFVSILSFKCMQFDF